ncbi:TrkA family potassium uptake protein [Deferribacterales bacterium Es71-Z0220]|uniref:potassium channel family protein n=1 Tax=Deferrivibrio essentukiensis TaxID=2880922 RepID=UPI001F615C45|nr:TrkA family potassium uptake protein [Deferrivibrio essentukiensis]MCB4204451.1 TrkA family potassium uptake protein [Deferrivibrio essentukiensis]
MKKDVAVFGLGYFGYSVARECYKYGHSVLAVDKNKMIVEQIKDDVTEAVCANVADEDTLKELAINKFDVVVLSMSNSFESQILTLAFLKRLEAKYVICKANTKIQEEILYKMGADQVILPEREIAKKVATKINFENFFEMLDLEGELKIVNIKANKNLIGKSLKELDLRRKYDLNILAIKRANDKLKLTVNPDYVINENDELIIVGVEENILKLM